MTVKRLTRSSEVELRAQGMSDVTFPESLRKSMSRVVLVRDVRSLDERRRPDPDVVSGMINRAIVALSDEPSIPRAFEHVLGLSGVVLIKGAQGVHEGVLDPLMRGLLTSGVSASRVVLYRKPRRSNGLGGDGLGRFACRYGVRTAETLYSHGSERAGNASFHLADVFYECDSIINVTLLSGSGSGDVGAALTSHLDSVREKPQLRRNRANGVLALNSLAILRQKTKLVVCDALEPLLERPGRSASHAWSYGGVLMAQDPVALDTVGTAIVSRGRTHLGLDGSMRSAWTALASAEKLGLGNAERERIDLVQIEV